MSPPSSSSAQRLREDLGRRLRELRVAAGLTATELGHRLGRHASKVSRIEHGTATPSVEDVTAWCEHCGAQDETMDLVASLRALDDLWTDWERLERGGFERAQVQFLDWFERARTLRAYSSWLVPGVLQTEDYTLAIWRLIAARRRVDDDIETAMPLRQARKRCLHDGRHRFVLLIEESVLRAGYGGVDVMLAQLAHLVAVSTLPSVALGIVPSRPDRTAWAVEDFWIFDDDQVNVELVSGHLTLTHHRDVAMYSQAFDALREQATFGPAARALITSAITALDAVAGLSAQTHAKSWRAARPAS